jgi:TPR repeat protein
MDKRLNTLVMAALLSGQAQALPVEAIGSFFGKLFKGGAAAKEAAIAGRAAEGAGAKGLEHLAASDTAKVGPALQAFESKPDMASDVMAMSRRDAEAYKAFRASAEKGDATAMLKMSEMTASGKIIDLGEPWRGYWLFQSARLGSQAAAQKSRDECSAKEGRRATDKWFDLACASSDGRSLFIGDKLPGTSYMPYGTGSPVKPAGLPGAKP